MRIALVYDCLFPNTVGGAERVYRSLAEQLDCRHQVTYVTRRQWGREGARTPFRTVAVSPGGDLYAASGRRRYWPPLRFAWGVFGHLLRNADRYDAVQTVSAPLLPLLAAALALRLRRSRARLVVDWIEVWTPEYWRDYMGPVVGRLGAAAQRLCLRLSDRSFTYSSLFERRLRQYGHRAPITRLTGAYTGKPERVRATAAPRPPVALFAGRHIPEKRVSAIPAAVAMAREEIPDLRCIILGEGPDTGAARAAVSEHGLEAVIEIRGWVETGEVARMMASSACLIHPSRREGYGLVLVEAAASGTPVVVVSGPDNAAAELVEEGVNGFVAESVAPAELASAVVSAVRGGGGLRRRTLDWYERNRDALSLSSSLGAVEASYCEPAGPARR